jgi:hypothetical protein
VKEKERRARRSAAQHDKMRVKQRERSGGGRQILVSILERILCRLYVIYNLLNKLLFIPVF